MGLQKRTGWLVSVTGKEGTLPIIEKEEKSFYYKKYYPQTTLVPNKHFHLTTRNLGKTTILIPSETWEAIEGISFAPSIEQAAFGIPDRQTNKNEHRQYYVYTPIEEEVAYKVDEEVDTMDIDEHRATKPTKSELIGIVDTWLDDNLEMKSRWVERY